LKLGCIKFRFSSSIIRAGEDFNAQRIKIAKRGINK